MKKFTLIILLLVQLPMIAQKMASDYFKEAENYFEGGNYKQAADVFYFIANRYPKNKLHPLALYNSALSYMKDKQDIKAIEIFNIIIEGSYNDLDHVRGSIMDDPYANYKHNSSAMISAIFFDKTDYTKALEYFILSNTKYRYNHFCGNELHDNEVYKVLRYAELYEKIGDEENKFRSLLTGILYENDEILNKLKPILKKCKNTKTLFDKSLAYIYAGEPDKSSNNTKYTPYYIKYYGAEILVHYTSGLPEKVDKREIVKKIKETKFYTQILSE